jgi:hypothetical protein
MDVLRDIAPHYLNLDQNDISYTPLSVVEIMCQ